MTDVLRRNPDALAQELDGEVLLLIPPQSEVLHLNPTASAVWRALELPLDVDGLVALLAEAYDAPPAELRTDLLALLPVLEDRQALVRG